MSTKKSNTCKRCKRDFQLGYVIHATINDCMRQAEAYGRAQRDGEVQHLQKDNASAWSKFHQEEENRRKEVADLKKLVVEKQAVERPMSDAELVAMSNMVNIEAYQLGRHAFGITMGTGPSIYSKVMAELKRRGLVG